MDINHQMEMHKLYAHLHMTIATTGSYKKRVGTVTRADGYVLTEEDLLEDTLNTAKRHISLYKECAENIFEKMNEKYP